MLIGNRRRIEVVLAALQTAIQTAVFRSTKGTRVSPRYRVAILAYSDEVYDILGGVKPIDQLANLGVPELSTMRGTDTARAFAEVEKLLVREAANYADCPAPLVCHMTDGEYLGADPEPIVQRIMEMENADGHVLVENIFISDKILVEPVKNLANWGGVTMETALSNAYARKLRAISSPLPDSYRSMMLECGYNLVENTRMMIPGDSQELVELGFVMSTSTPTS